MTTNTTEWAELKVDELWTCTLDSGELAAVWRYSGASGTFYKLLTDRDRGDYATLGDAMAAARRLEVLDGFGYDGPSLHGVPLEV